MKNYILIFMIFLTAFGVEGKDQKQRGRKKFLKYEKHAEEFKKKMPVYMRAYYLPRKKYIDRQPIDPALGPFSQLYILVYGAELREKYRSNIKQIRKLEKFLEKADDFELKNYFTRDEEKYLSMKAEKAIKIIQELAEQDEDWRRSNDPVFARYLHSRASKKEKQYYAKNKSRFYSEKTGWDLVILLREETERER